MSQENLFARIKEKCSEKRIVANGTGKPSVFTITKDNVHHVFSIGLKALGGNECVSIGVGDKATLEARVAKVAEYYAHANSLSKDLTHEERRRQCQKLVDVGATWAIEDVSYDTVNVSLSGTLAAVYGTHTPLKAIVFTPVVNPL